MYCCLASWLICWWPVELVHVVTSLTVSPLSYQLAVVSKGYTGPYQPAQEQSVAGQSPPQYCVSSEASFLDEYEDTPAMPSPPAYYVDIEKELDLWSLPCVRHAEHTCDIQYATDARYAITDWLLGVRRWEKTFLVRHRQQKQTLRTECFCFLFYIKEVY